jgi:replicative DNA helicase
MDSSDLTFAEFVLKAHRIIGGLKKCKDSYITREAIQTTTAALELAYNDQETLKNSLERQRQALHELEVREQKEFEHFHDPDKWVREWAEQIEDQEYPEPFDLTADGL